MLLGAHLLTAVSTVNSFDYATAVEASQGDAFDVYLRLVDRERHRAEQGYEPAGLRYVPAAGATMTVEFVSIDNAKRFTRVATQPFPGDPSIWKAAVLASDPVRGTVDLKVALTEAGVTRTFRLQAAVLVGDTSGVC